MSSDSSKNKPSVCSVDEAIALCLKQRDEGMIITPRYLLETFPDLQPELVDFFEAERLFLRQCHDDEPVGLTTQNISRFELQRRIGSGSFGEVWEAWDTLLLRIVAIKTPRANFSSRISVERFIREARTVGQLDHPNIVRVLEVGQFENTPFICSELIEGKSLAEWSADSNGQRHVVTPEAAARVMTQIASAVAHAHERQIIHRDLNPRNIIVDCENTPYVLDFGVAKWSQDPATVTLHGEVMGTPAYVSPEQASGNAHNLDGRSDIFSLGVILYEMLTTHRPFRGNLKLLLHQIRFEKAISPHEIDPEIPVSLANVCLKCLEKRPENRYQSAADLQRDLDRFLNGDQSPFPGPSAGSRYWTVKRRRLTATAMCLAAIIAISVASWRYFLAPNRTKIGPAAPGVASVDNSSIPPTTALAVADPTLDSSRIDSLGKIQFDDVSNDVDVHLFTNGLVATRESPTTATLTTFNLDGAADSPSVTSNFSPAELTVIKRGLVVAGVTFDASLTVTGSGNLNQLTTGLGVDGDSNPINDGEALTFSMDVRNARGGSARFDGFTKLDLTFFDTEGEQVIFSMDGNVATTVDNFCIAEGIHDDPVDISTHRPTAFTLFGHSNGGTVSFRVDSIDATFSASPHAEAMIAQSEQPNAAHETKSNKTASASSDHVFTIERQIELMIDEFREYCRSMGLTDRGWAKQLDEQCCSFERQSNRLKDRHEKEKDWQSIVMRLADQRDRINDRMKSRNIGDKARLHWASIESSLAELESMVLPIENE